MWEVVDALVISLKLRLASCQDLPYGALRRRHGPAAAVGMHASHGLRQREPHGSGPRFLVEPHRREQLLRGRARGERERETVAREQPPDPIGGSPRGEAQPPRAPRPARPAARHPLAPPPGGPDPGPAPARPPIATSGKG